MHVVDPSPALSEQVLKAKRRLLRMHFESKVGHIGGNLSCLDILVALFQEALYAEDRFVLSKGHAAGALYTALWVTGRLEEAALATFHGEGTLLAGHPVAGWHDDITFATGSLGHGLSLAAGLAHGKLLRREPGTVFCLLSDGELNEGAVWEALHYAAHHHLGNLRVVVDVNGLQGFGRTDEVVRLGSLAARLEAAGLAVVELDGHRPELLAQALIAKASRPTVLVAHTVKGKGVSFMESRMEWHYLPLSESLYELALAELDAPATDGRALASEPCTTPARERRTP